MQFRRSRTQVLYRYLPGAIFEHDSFAISRVTDVVVTSPGSLNEVALKNALKSFLVKWEGFGAESYPDPDDEWYEYKVGVPDRVIFEPFPPIVECSVCGHITSLDKLVNVKSKEYRCTHCGKGKYHQLPYVVIHNCGKVEPVPLPKCDRHEDEHLRFNDTGRFVTSEWFCVHGDYRRGMPRYKCRCAYSRLSPDPNAANDKYVRINDSSLMYTHTVHFVNLPEKLIAGLLEDSKPVGLVLARLWGLLDDNVYSVAERRSQAQSKIATNLEVRRLIEQLLENDPNNPNVKQLIGMVQEGSQLPGEAEINYVETLLPAEVASRPSQTLLEFIALRDAEEVDLITPEQAVESMIQRGDNLGVQDFRRGLEYANETLGFNWIGCITNFPMAAASIGYSRVANNPGDAFINPFRTTRIDTDKIPIYVLTTETEAILLQLDPQRVTKWLFANGFVKAPLPQSEAESWGWLRRHLPTLSKFRGLLEAPDDLDLAEEAVLTLLHTISHLLMRQIEWSGFDPESVGEYLLPEALSIVIHSNNYSSFTIGGMVTMYEQRLHGWLKDAFSAAFKCAYNPICEDEGGSCIGCLHRQHNCEGFNHYLSRAVLQGGTGLTPSIHVNYGFWTSDFR